MKPEDSTFDFPNPLLLLTGSDGWLGRGLLTALIKGIPDHPRLNNPDKNIRIRAFVLEGSDVKSIEKISERIEIFEGDIRNETDCKRFMSGAEGCTLLHIAGLIHPNRIKDLYEVNLNGTRNLLEAAAKKGVRRAVVMSSNSPIGCNPSRDDLFDETSPYSPYMHYGKSKMLMEKYVKELMTKERLELVIIRSTWFYGPFQPPRQSVFFKMIRDGKVPIVGDGNNLRSMGYIENVSQGILLAALTKEANGNTYWIADDRPYSMNEIIDTIERLLESEFDQVCKHKRMRIPSITSELAYIADQMIQSMGMYNQKIHVLSEMNKTIACSVDKAKQEIGYMPTVILEEGMRRSLKWVFENQGGLD